MDKPIKMYRPTFSAGRIYGTLIGVCGAALVLFIWWHQLSVPERFYLPQYVQSSLAAELPAFAAKPNVPKMYTVITNQEPLPTQPKDRMPVCFDGATFTTDSNIERHPEWPVTPCQLRVKRAVFIGEICQFVYGKSAGDVLKLPAEISGSLLLIAIVAGKVYDARRRRKMVLQGEQTRGPWLLSQAQYNRRMIFGKDGIRIVTVGANRKVDF